jgi:ABC-2 type transport system ATP-binding protein
MSDFPSELLLLVVPLVIVELGLTVLGLWDLTRPGRRVRGGSRLMWALIILFINVLGPIIYFAAGREEREDEATADGAAASAGAPPAPGAVSGWARPGAAAGGPGPAAGSASGAGSTSSPSSEPREPGEPRLEPAAPIPVPAPWPATRGAPADGDTAIVVRGLTKRYGGEPGVLALDRLDLDVPAGSVFGLLGPNGAGKTTTLRMLAGLAHPSGGTATVAGTPIDGAGPALTRRIGYLDQDPRYYGWATGSEIVMLVGLLHGMRGAALEARTREVLAQVGLTEAAGRRLATYSGGMRQRLGIAQALVNRPPLLILDEPVSSLDPEGRRDLLALIAALRGSTTVLFSTHVLSDVERICDRVGILDHGRLVTEGPLDELLDRYALPIYRLDPEDDQAAAVEHLTAKLRAADWATDVVVEHGYIKVTVADPALAARELLPVVVEAGVALVSYERVRPTLEDVFLQLVGRNSEAAA